MFTTYSLDQTSNEKNGPTKNSFIKIGQLKR